MSVYVSIGRNTGSAVMSDESWDSFRAQTRAAVIRGTDGGDIVSTTVGVGVFEGVREETAIVVHSGTPNDRLRMLLSVLAARFNQESIALAITEPEFVS